MSILLEGTWISHPHPTDGLCDVFPGKANLSQKFQFIPEKDCLHPFFSLAFVLSIKNVSLFSSPLKGKTMSPLSSEAYYKPVASSRHGVMGSAGFVVQSLCL